MRVLVVMLAFCAGGAVGIGAAAFLTALGVGARLAGWTRTQEYIRGYVWALILGIFVFTAAQAFGLRVEIGAALTAAALLLMGIFVGMQACALAEVLDGIPHTLAWLPGWAWRAALLGLVSGKVLFSLLDLIRGR